jgi:molecular chaperone DnaK (HSP70)
MDNVVEVNASHGNIQLGGDDFDELLTNPRGTRFEVDIKVIAPIRFPIQGVI